MTDNAENSGDLQTEGQALRVQTHGGALRSGNPGNKGGGRPKESLRRRMRRILGKTLTAIERDLDALDGSNGAVGILANQSKEGPVQGPLTRADAVKFAEIAAKYGVGKEDKREVEKTTTNYVIALPARVPRAAKTASAQRIAVVDAPGLPAGNAESDAARGETL